MTTYLFDHRAVDDLRREVRVRGVTVQLEPRAFDVLIYLLRHRHRVVPRLELQAAVWGVEHISSSTISKAIWQVRRALRDRGSARLILTLYGRGYRLVAPVTTLASADSVCASEDGHVP